MLTLQDIVDGQPIDKGWSGDQKYRVTDRDGCAHLLRISPINKYEHRKNIDTLLRKLEDVPMCVPQGFGTCEQGVYTFFSWIDGEDAEAVLPQMSPEEAYRLGVQAGRILQRIHSIPAPSDLPSWEERFGKKIDAKIQKYRECPLHFAGDAVVIGFVEAYRALLAGRPQCFQHGDYHVGNMMIGQNQLYIIDFDRFDYGDPWEEFNRIVWCAQLSPAFAAGRIDGYFDGAPPEDFFALLALYISVNTLSSLPWAIPFGQQEVDTMLAQARLVLQWYDDMQTVIPSWYRQYKGI